MIQLKTLMPHQQGEDQRKIINEVTKAVAKCSPRIQIPSDNRFQVPREFSKFSKKARVSEVRRYS